MGKSAAPPPAPDYTALAQQTSASNAKAASDQTQANRVNQVTPFGQTSWNNARTTDQAGYDKALADYNAQNQQGTWNPATEGTPTYDPVTGETRTSGATPGYYSGTTHGGVAPKLSDFMKDNWTQTTTLDPAEQAQLDKQRQLTSQQSDLAGGLLGKAAGSLGTPLSSADWTKRTGFDQSQLPNVDPNSVTNGVGPLASSVNRGQQNNMGAGFGSVQTVTDAMMSRLQPQRDQARQGEIQRLKNQGLSENSAAFQRAVTRLDQGDTDAQMQGLLAGTQEYGNEFNRGLAQNAQNFGFGATDANLQNSAAGQQFGQNASIQSMLSALRGQKFGEQNTMANTTGNQRNADMQEALALRQSPLNDLNQLKGGQVTNPSFTNFFNQGNAGGVDYSGAGQQQYGAITDANNVANANSQSQTQGLMSIASIAAMAF